MNAVWQWLAANAPLLAISLAAACVLLVVVAMLLLMRLSEERAVARRAATKAATARAARGLEAVPRRDAEGLWRASDWQANAVAGLGEVLEGVQSRGDRGLALSLSTVLADLERAQTELDRVVRLPPSSPLDSLDRLLAAADDFGIEIDLSEAGVRRPLRRGYEAAVTALVREGVQVIAQLGGSDVAVVVHLDWTRADLLVAVEQRQRSLPAYLGRHALPSASPQRPLAFVPGGRDVEDMPTAIMRQHVERFGGVFLATRTAQGARLFRALFAGSFGPDRGAESSDAAPEPAPIAVAQPQPLESSLAK